jgi:hypothetical protein
VRRPALTALAHGASARRSSGRRNGRPGTNKGTNEELNDDVTHVLTRRGLREDETRWRSVFPAHANTGDPNGPFEACPLMTSQAR